MAENEDIMDEDFWKKSGDDYFKQGKYEEAIKCYNEAVELDPNYLAAWNNLGFSYFKLGRLDEAKKCKDRIKAIQESQKSPPPEEKKPSPEVPKPPSSSTSGMKPEVPEYKDNLVLVGLLIAGVISIFIPIIGVFFVLLIVVLSAYLVFKDAQEIGAGRAPGSWSPVTLGVLVLLFWLFALPIYLIKRRSMYEAGQSAASQESGKAAPQTSGVVMALIIVGVFVIFLILAAVIAAFVFGMAGSTAPSVPSADSQGYIPAASAFATVSTTRSTPAPTATPRPTTVSVPLKFSGNGDDVVAFSASGSSLRVFTMSYSGGSNYIIWLKDSQGNLVDLLVNEIGSYSGKKSARLTSGDYYLDVTAAGPWSVEISPSVTRIPATTGTPLVLKGYGDDVTSFTATGTGLRVFTMNYNGGSNFIIWLKDSQGNLVDLLVNEIGSYNGKKSERLISGDYYLDITATGPWSIEINS